MTQMDAALEAPQKTMKIPLLIGTVLMVALGAGSFFALYSGLIPPTGGGASSKTEAALPGISYVALDPMVISLGDSGTRHLRFTAQLEVPGRYLQEVELYKPRVIDVLNGYLRAVDVKQLEDPNALFRMRAQMLRRLQVITGDGRIQDLLIIEFVLN